MNIGVNIDPKEATKEGFAVVRVTAEPGSLLGQLDVEFSKLAPLNNGNPKALDFLLLAATVYALDKLVDRTTAADCWTRDFNVTIPVSDPAAWKKVGGHLAECTSFLTGDVWTWHFSPLSSPLVRPIRRRRRRRRGQYTSPLTADVVSLFSGGLDSLVGVIDRLERSKANRILLVGHHDGQMAGPL